MSTKLHTILLVLLFVVAGFFATYHLTESPPVWMDEGIFTQAAANLATYGQTGLRVSPDTIEPSSKLITVGYPFMYPLAGWFKMFDISILSARSLMAVFIIGFLLVSYFFVRRLFGPWQALGSLALIATLPTLYGNGKSVLGEVPGLLYLVASLVCLCVARGRVTQRYLWFVLAGLFAGLSVATKPIFVLLVPAALIGFYIAWRRHEMTVMEVGAAIGAGLAPIFAWLILQFRVSDSAGSLLSFYVNHYQITDWWSTIFANLRNLVTDIGPLYLLVVLSLWLVAYGIRLRRQERIPVEEHIVLAFSVITLLGYLTTAGWYRYLFEAQTLSLLFLPNTLALIARSVCNGRYLEKLAISVIVVLSLFGAYQVMFSSFVAESYGRRQTANWEEYFRTASPSASFFFYDAPEVAFFAQGTKYYQYLNPYDGIGIFVPGWDIGSAQRSVLTQGNADVVILPPAIYEKEKDNLFSAYEIDRAIHNYFFLKKK
ncbi:glycosyltransferase family 39 protein [Candidatus Kaiserbacteria bacterium]|nr:glycosyltransferase family 39 protein [Candidatus Kaiserbacteria bacterium]